jgi:ribosome-associated protein
MVLDAKEKAWLCLKAAMEKKAADPVLLEMKKITSYTDYFLIVSGSSDRQVQAIARAVEEALHEKGVRPLGLEGVPEGRWVLMDYGDVIVHVFLEQLRTFYELESLWIDAPRLEL